MKKKNLLPVILFTGLMLANFSVYQVYGQTQQNKQVKQQTVMYTCPMHPEVIQDHPGNCPKCSMALEPVTVGGEEKNEELVDMSRRFWVCTVLSLPVFFLAMIADMMPSWLPNWLSMQAVQWTEFALATPVVLWGGGHFLFAAGNPSGPGISTCLP